MNYKEAYEQFIVDYHNECANQGKTPRKLDKTVALSYLSKAYVYLGNTYELVEAAPVTLQMISGQYEYTTGTGVSNIPANVLRIHTVRINNLAKTKIDKMEEENMPSVSRPSGLPGRYGVRGTNSSRKLILDTIPDKSYTTDSAYGLVIGYKEKIIRFTVTATGTSFSDLNFNSAGWGGSFKLPTEWEDLLVKGAVAEIMNDKYAKQEFKLTAEEMNRNRADKTYVNRTPKYFFGI